MHNYKLVKDETSYNVSRCLDCNKKDVVLGRNGTDENEIETIF